ncbi:MAG: protein kinase [Planctomycetota bacterium]|nr:protein kinase [Planctomycetota bacterium]
MIKKYFEPNTELTGVDKRGRCTYEVRGTLGAGGQGDVYLANRTYDAGGPLDTVAVKVPDPRAVGRSGYFSGAATAHVGSIRNAAIADAPAQVVFTNAQGDPDQATVLVMPHVPGDAIANSMHDKNKPLGAAATANVLGQMALTLRDLEERKLVHRDIKPLNIMQTPAGADATSRATLVDWDLAVEAGAPVHPSGTLQYMAPESMLGHPPHPKSDMYGLGASAVTMMTNQTPRTFGKIPRAEAERRVCSGEPMRDVGSPYLGLVIDRATTFDMTKRSDATDLMVDLLPLPEATRTWKDGDFQRCADRLIQRHIGAARSAHGVIDAFASRALLSHLPADHPDRDSIGLIEKEGAPLRGAWATAHGEPAQYQVKDPAFQTTDLQPDAPWLPSSISMDSTQPMPRRM